MCQATVYLGDERVAEEITGLEILPDGVRLMAFFEEPMVVHGRIRNIDFLRHRVLLEPVEAGLSDEGD